ncbi:low temperature requirement protein A (plasmid) [Streptomyces sp. HUAS TT3]|uniref:low temperature requirement protein A n=1 Tax=Streptomyces sp. HUAS TT3 TaxID=3447510 RepID=UPI003F65E188
MPLQQFTGAEEEADRRVTTLELFFDLVFVFTLTQLTVLLAHDLTFATAGRVALIFVVLFWMYGAYAYLTNQVPPDRPARRLLLLLGMGGFLVCALAVPRAFGDAAAGTVFGLGYLLVVLVHSALYTRSHGRDVIWYAIPNSAAALSITAAGPAEGIAAEGLWVLALVLQFVTPYISQYRPGRRDGRTPDDLRVQLGGIDAAHFVERHGLLLIVAFGESVIAIAIGIGIGDLPLTPGIFGGTFLALALAAALWWTYFVRDEHAAEAVFRRTAPPDRFRLAMNAFYYCFLPMLLGIAALAAGIKKVLGHLGEPLATAPTVALAGGVALFLAGETAFRAALKLAPLRFRAVTALLAVATVPVGLRHSGLAQLIALVVLVVAMLVVEHRSLPKAAHPESDSRAPDGDGSADGVPAAPSGRKGG